MDRSPRRRRLPRWLRRGLLGALALLAFASIPSGLFVRFWWKQAQILADAHVRHQVAHPGWSFPARIYSERVPLAAPPARLLAEARARGYVEKCPRPAAGQFCERTATVVPRAGAELEPVLLGWIVGPEGEIREHLPLSDAPRHLVDAILAAEDRGFRQHGGVNWAAAGRAALANLRRGGYAQGGSTLTMQIVRAFAGQREKTLGRKVREAVMALAIDRHLGKDGVLQAYLDAPYLGQRGGLSISGFQAASRHYFARDAKELTLAQAALLAAILPGPARYAPDRFPERARERRDRVLRAMAQLYGYDVAAALAEPIALAAPQPLPERHPAYLSATRAWLESRLDRATLYGTGLKVTAGIDLPAQEETERLFAAKTRYLENLVGARRPAPLQSAAVLLDVETGRLRAIWGGFGETSTGFNRATQARRQPGSAFKPLVYALALSQPDRFTAASLEPNALRVFKTPQGEWTPRNVSGEYTPTASLAYGLALSQNIATASLLQDLGGPLPLIEFAGRLGFDTRRFVPEMGLALGQSEVTPLEMAQFAATVANGGRRVVGTPVLSAIDASGIERLAPPRAGPPVLSPEAAALTRELMRLVVDFGTGGAVRGAGDEPGYKGPVMGKTGTTDHEKDVWFVGATPRAAGAVWIGYDQPEPLGGSASDLAAPLWGWWMGRLTRHDAPLPTFPETPRLARRWICSISGRLAAPGCPALHAPFLPGSEPKGACAEDHSPPPPVEGVELKPKYEGLWQRLAREKAEREGATAPPSPPPGPPPAEPPLGLPPPP